MIRNDLREPCEWADATARRFRSHDVSLPANAYAESPPPQPARPFAAIMSGPKGHRPSPPFRRELQKRADWAIRRRRQNLRCLKPDGHKAHFTAYWTTMFCRAVADPTRQAESESAGEGSRTPMSFRTDGFEPSAYTIPPPRPES